MNDQAGAERLWQLTAEHSPVGMCLVGPEGTLLSANRALCAMFGYSEDELRARTFQEITHPDDLDADLELFDQALRGERSSYRITKRYLHADGSIVWGDLSVAIVRDDVGETLHFISQILDVSGAHLDRERLSWALNAIQRQRRTAQAILSTVDVGLVLVDDAGRNVQTNRRHADFMALAFPDGDGGRADVVGLMFAADGVTPLRPDDLPAVRALRGETVDDYRLWVGDDPLTRRALSVSARAVRDLSGDFTEVALAYSDVTDLMQALQSREHFMAAVSHELRSPLTSVLGNIELLRDSEDLPDDVLRGVEVIQRNALRLHHLVSDLLETAYQREGPVPLVHESVDVADLVREAVEAARPTALVNGVDLDTDAEGPLPAQVDPARLRQVVDNLVSNALKYTDPGGRVEVEVGAGGGTVAITVTDTGIGISPSDLEKLFTPFFRSRQAQMRLVPGVGLGLGIARAIVVAHGGRLEVVSTLGQGTTFSVTLPRRLVRGEVPAARADDVPVLAD